MVVDGPRTLTRTLYLSLAALSMPTAYLRRDLKRTLLPMVLKDTVTSV